MDTLLVFLLLHCALSIVYFLWKAFINSKEAEQRPDETKAEYDHRLYVLWCETHSVEEEVSV